MLLPSSSLQPGRVHVVWGGGLSWQLETTTTSAFFTEVLFPYEDVLRLTFIGIFLVLALCSCTVWRRVGGVGGGAENLMVVVGSLVGRLALVLILAEAAVFLTINSRSAVTGDDDNQAAGIAAGVYTSLAVVLLFTVSIGDAWFAPKCWFPTDRRYTIIYRN